jgi:FtsH-binding integral membrane protein
MSDVPAPRLSSTAAAAERTFAFLRSVYGWMFIGLAVTAMVGAVVAGSPAATQAIAALASSSS